MLSIGSYVFCWPVYICNNLKETMLLGDDFLKAHRGVLNYEDRLFIENQWEKTPLLSSQLLELARVSVSETVVIPHKTVCNISCKVVGSNVREGFTGI